MNSIDNTDKLIRMLASLSALERKSSSLLNEMAESNIISAEDSTQLLMNKKSECVLKLHPYNITPPQSETGRWQTYIRDPNGKRKIIRAQTKETLITKLVKYYESELNLENMTFHKLFEDWLKYKGKITDSDNTILRHQQHYKRYFESSVLNSMPIRKLTRMGLTEECNRIVKDYSMSRKEWVNVKTIIKGMFFYAKEKHLIAEDLSEGIKITVKYRQVNKKTGKTETYNTEELKALNEYLDSKYDETGDVVFMAVRINFFLGLRVAELTALKWEDIGETSVHVVREEVRNQMTNITTVVPHTKTSRDRFVALIPKAKDILNKLPHNDSEYIFVRTTGKRIIAKDVATVLEKYAEVAGTIVKSTHKIRKTYASMLNTAGVPLDAIREELGHTELQTTLSYLYNPLTDEETFSKIAEAL